MNQISLDTLEKEKDRAIYAAGAFADAEWRKAAEECVRTLCEIGDDFSGDDCWRLLDEVGVKTPEPRALGAIIKKFAVEGKIFPTGEYRKSMRRESHRRPLSVWRPVRYKRVLREAE